MSDIIRFDVERRGSRAVVYNGIVYLSGMTAPDRSEDIKGQTRQTWREKPKGLRSVAHFRPTGSVESHADGHSDRAGRSRPSGPVGR